MKAIVQRRYGPPAEVLELQDVDRPAIKDDEVLVRVHASTVAGDDWHLMRGLPYVARVATGLFKPRNSIPGLEAAGRVEALGRNVQRLRVGDEVFGWCKGGLAEYVSVAVDALALKPANLTFEQAAAIPISGFTALQGLRDMGQVQPGQEVLINGAAGGVGTLAVQMAKSMGARVTGVCSERNAELVRSLGADQVIDYEREDFTQGDGRYDLVLDMIGNRSLGDCRRALRPKGTLVLVGARGGPWFMGTERSLKALALSPFVSQRLRPLIHWDNQGDLAKLKGLAASGELEPVIDSVYPLAEVPKAVEYLEGRHARGKVAIII